MKRTTLLLMPLLLALVGSACGGDDDKDDSPAGKCQVLADAYCTKVIGCGKFGGSHSSCTSMFSKSVECDKAVSVSSEYGSCLSTMRNASCDVVTLTPPPICNGVILVP